MEEIGALSLRLSDYRDMTVPQPFHLLWPSDIINLGYHRLR